MSDQKPDDREQRFLSALVTTMVERDWGMFKALKAANGFLMREQTEDERPGEVERFAAVTLPHIEADMQEAWLFGFRFRDAEATIAAADKSPDGVPA